MDHYKTDCRSHGLHKLCAPHTLLLSRAVVMAARSEPDRLEGSAVEHDNERAAQEKSSSWTCGDDNNNTAQETSSWTCGTAAWVAYEHECTCSRFKEPRTRGRPGAAGKTRFRIFESNRRPAPLAGAARCRPRRARRGHTVPSNGCDITPQKSLTTLCGGSLGSCVDEERSQLCELM